MNFFLNFLTILSIFTIVCESITLDCNFGVDSSHGYTCDVQNPILITSSEDRLISEARGQHDLGKSNDDVKVFRSGNNQINFFPRGLTNVLKNIDTVWIYNGGLQEITKEDLKPFGGNLRNFFISQNSIEFITSDLLKFNRNLEHLIVNYNQISHIDSGAFDGLEKLHSIDFTVNPCMPDNQKFQNLPTVLEKIQYLEKECQLSQFSLTKLISDRNSAKIVEEISKVQTEIFNLSEKFEKDKNEVKNLIADLKKNFNDEKNLKKDQEIDIRSNLEKIGNFLGSFEENFGKLILEIGGKVEKFCVKEEETSAH